MSLLTSKVLNMYSIHLSTKMKAPQKIPFPFEWGWCFIEFDHGHDDAFPAKTPETLLVKQRFFSVAEAFKSVSKQGLDILRL